MNSTCTFLNKQQWYKVVLAFVSAIAFLIKSDAQTMLVGLASGGGPAGGGSVFSITTTGSNFSVIKGFEDWGNTPNGSLLKDSDGNFYGMTRTGGIYNAGSIFKMAPDGTITILKQLNLNVDGGYPDGELIKGADGFFYGLTSASSNYGTIFKISSSGVYTVIRNLSYATDGANPHGHLTLAKDGNFYGITHGGGTNGVGTIFKLTPDGSFSVIHMMNKTTEGGDSYGSLTEGKDGNLYGVTYDGGTYNYGTIFKVTTGGTLTVLKHLNQPTDGAYAQCDLIQATDNNFYGTTYSGGSIGYGTIFKITSAGSFSVIKNLSYSSDGALTYSGLTQNTDGNLYGITRGGGSKGAGTIYKLTLAGVFTTLHSFDPAVDGGNSSSALIKGADNNLYALCSAGGAYNFGTAFKVSTSGVVTVLNNFNGASFGNAPYSTFIKGKDSAYYATTSAGGAYGYGSIVKICGGVTSVLHSFNKSTEGGYPKGKLLLANDGNFYGMTSDGGSKNAGTIFKLTPSGNFSVLYTFNSATDGGNPLGGLMQAKDGLLYGVTISGGSNTSGTIFKISLSGTFTLIRSFVNATDGNSCKGDLLQASDDNFYGMTSTNGKIFKLTPSGTFSIIHTFNSSTDGYVAVGSLMQGNDGNLYGSCSDGGAGLAGTLFKISLSGTFNVLHAFNNTTDGKAPKGTLLQDASGTLYGTTSIGGANNAGTIFRIAKDGSSFKVLHAMNLDSDGGYACGGLIFAPVNNLIANAQNVTTNEDTKLNITLTGSGGSPLAFAIVAKPKHGTISGTAPNVSYKPASNYNGKDSFGFNVNVGCISSKPAFIKITVKPVADTPVLALIADTTVAKNSTLKFTASAKDADKGETITYSLINAPQGASINATTGVFTWTPLITGTFSFKIRATDNSSLALYDEQQVTVTVVNTLKATTQSNAIASVIEAQLYPNPVSNEVHVTIKESVTNAAIKIVDMSGRVLVSKQFQSSCSNNFVINVAGLISGIYILQLQTGNTSSSFKFIKQ